MNIKAQRSGQLCLLFLALSLLAGASHGQETRKQLEERISKLRAEEQNLEDYRAELQRDLQKSATTDESGRARYVLMTGTGSGGPFWTFVPREQYERLIAIGVLIGEMTPQRAALDIEETVGKTKVFPQAARARLRETEQVLARIKRGLSALEGQLAQLKGNTQPDLPADVASQFTMEPNTQIDGSASRALALGGVRANLQQCLVECAKDPNCIAYAYARPGHAWNSPRDALCKLIYASPKVLPPHPNGLEKFYTSGVKKKPS